MITVSVNDAFSFHLVDVEAAEVLVRRVGLRERRESLQHQAAQSVRVEDAMAHVPDLFHPDAEVAVLVYAA